MTGQLLLVLLSGMLGSAHCLGMCGGFAVLVGMPARSLRPLIVRQLAYSAGRIFTYSILGGLAGYVGVRLANSPLLPKAINVAAVLSMACGIVLVVEGLRAAGVRLWRRSSAGSACGGCLSTGMFSAFLRSPGNLNAFLGGLLTGFLPCGLVYGFLALAAAERDPLRGLGIMAAFGLGTVPLMVIAGMGIAVMSLGTRRRLLRLAAVSVVVTGALTLFRGYGFLMAGEPSAGQSCPFCNVQSSNQNANPGAVK